MPAPIPFTPPHVSVNRVRIIDLPGVRMDKGVRGCSAYELLSTKALIQLALVSADALALPQAWRYRNDAREQLPRYVDRCLNHDDDRIRNAAEGIARRLGRNLGHILLTLHRADAVNRAARFDWSEEDWRRWRQIRQIWLAGGLVSGGLGEHIVQNARDFLDETGYASAIQIRLSPHRQHMTLLGAGRYLPATTGVNLVFDFGHTFAKRACVYLDQQAITNLNTFSAASVNLPWLDTFPPHNEQSGQEVLKFMADLVAETRHASIAQGHVPGPDIMIVVAAYVEGGALLGNGLYVNLNTLRNDARLLLAEAIENRIQSKVNIHLIHDGTAAATIHAGADHTAVIMIGTALGVGFPELETAGLKAIQE